jgi:hypothetical protein
MIRTWLVAAVGALASAFLVVPAQAAPAGSLTADLKTAVGNTAGVEKVHNRSHRYHRYGRHRQHSYRAWRRPAVQLYFGHRRHHKHHKLHKQHRRWR